MVVVVDGDQVAELQVAGGGASLAGDTLLGATITKEGVGVVVDQVESGLVERGGGLRLGDGETDGVGDTLAKRAGGDLNSGGVVGLGVTGADAVDLAELFQVLDADCVAEKVEEGVVEHASVAVGKHEAVAVDPVGVLGVEGHELVEEDVGHRRHAHGRARVARVGLEGSIDLARRIESQFIVFHCFTRPTVRGAPTTRAPNRHRGSWKATHRESADRVDTQLVVLVVTHGGGCAMGWC